MRVLITGACGFVGRNLIAELENRGHELCLLDMTCPEHATMFPGGAERAHVSAGSRVAVHPGWRSPMRPPCCAPARGSMR